MILVYLTSLREALSSAAGYDMIVFYLLVSVMPMLRHPLWSEAVGDITVIKCLGVVCLTWHCAAGVSAEATR